jgi:hypothetical protein
MHTLDESLSKLLVQHAILPADALAHCRDREAMQKVIDDVEAADRKKKFGWLG